MLLSWVLVLAAAFAAGVVNALAGGGMFLTFPALLFLGLDPIAANATSSTITLPGGAVSAWIYRIGSPVSRGVVARLIAVSVIGGIVGSELLILTPSQWFARMVPYLMLTAALVFSFSKQLRKYAADHTPDKPHTAMLLGWQFLIGIYGGYFGAGMGVVMIVVFGIAAGLKVQESAGLRMWCATAINGLAVGNFVLRGLVDWRIAIPGVAMTILGGTIGAHAFKRLDPEIAKRTVLAYAWVTGVWLLIRSWQ